MDFIYNDGSKDLSLESLTTTKIIQKILEDKGMPSYFKKDRKTIASKAIEAINNLPLPFLLKWQLRRMVLPIMYEMQRWYHNKNKAFGVVLKQNGTVDLPKSIRSMFNNENVSLMQRFKVACDYCLQQEIFDIGAQIKFPHDFCRPEPKYEPWLYSTRCWSLAEIWYKIYEGNFHAKLSLRDISEDYCNEGLVQAIFMGNSVGVKYFAERASTSTIMCFNRIRVHSIYCATSFTPDIGIKMFKRLNEDERQQLESYFSAELLKALLEWPYQHEFLKAAESLVKNMDDDHFWTVTTWIVRKARYGYEDHDYKGIFINFWKLGSKLKISFDPFGLKVINLLYDIILMQDERLAHFFLDNTTKNFKTHGINFYVKSACLRLILKKHANAVEHFMKVCRENNDKLFVKFCKDFPKLLKHVPSQIYDVPFLNLKKENWKNILREFLSRMDKLNPQISGITM